LTIFTDSGVSLDSLQNPNNDAHLVQETKNKLTSMVTYKWKIKFSFVKAHVGIIGNEMADSLTKEAARSEETNYVFSRIPINGIYRETTEEGIIKEKWE